MTLHQTELAKQSQHYADVRRRLMGLKQPRPVEAPKKVAVAAAAPVIHVPKARPLWTWAETHFDEHVRVWRLSSLEATIAHLIEENEKLRAVLTAHENDDEFGIDAKRPVKEIVEDVLKDFPGITWKDVRGKRRTKDIVYPRHLCMYEVHRQRNDMSYPMIGRFFGGKDHTTIINAVVKIAGMSERDHRRELATQRKWAKKRRKYVRDRIRELEAMEAAA